MNGLQSVSGWKGDIPLSGTRPWNRTLTFRALRGTYQIFGGASTSEKTCTARVAPWYLMVNNEVEQCFMFPAFSTNDAEMELQAVLAGRVIGQLANFSAASHIRAGRLVPLLVQHVSTHIGFYVYYGSRASQPRRVRAFLDLVLKRLQDSPDILLSTAELQAAACA